MNITWSLPLCKVSLLKQLNSCLSVTLGKFWLSLIQKMYSISLVQKQCLNNTYYKRSWFECFELHLHILLCTHTPKKHNKSSYRNKRFFTCLSNHKNITRLLKYIIMTKGVFFAVLIFCIKWIPWAQRNRKNLNSFRKKCKLNMGKNHPLQTITFLRSWLMISVKLTDDFSQVDF